jgi:hypothetical protein
MGKLELIFSANFFSLPSLLNIETNSWLISAQRRHRLKTWLAFWISIFDRLIFVAQTFLISGFFTTADDVY